MNEKLGMQIELEWQTPSWDLITAGNWGGRWDMSIGSMSVTTPREKVVDFADPYYYDFGAVAIPKDSTITSLKDLDGKTICVGAATTYETWLNGELEVPGTLAPPPVGATSPRSRRTTSASRRTSRPQVRRPRGEREQPGQRGQAGHPLKILEVPPPFVVKVSFALDKSGPDTAAMLALLNEIVADMHADGTLTKFSNEFLGKDVTQAPS